MKTLYMYIFSAFPNDNLIAPLTTHSKVIIVHYHHSSSFLMEHRSSTNARHLTLFRTVAFAPHHVSPLSSNSDILVHLQVSRGLPLLRFPCGFHSGALLATCPSGLLSVWPIQPHARCFISSSIGRCSVCLHSSSFQILMGH